MDMAGEVYLQFAKDYPGLDWALKEIKAHRATCRGLARACGRQSHAELSRMLKAPFDPKVTAGMRQTMDAELVALREKTTFVESRERDAPGTNLERDAQATLNPLNPLIEERPCDVEDVAAWWRDVAVRTWGWNMKDLAREIGYDDSTLSRIYSGKYEGNVEKVLEAMRVARGRVLGPSQGVTIRTAAAERIRQALDESQGSPYMTVILGDAGVGKTSALQRYERLCRQSSRQCLLIVMDQNATVKTLSTQLLERMGQVATGQVSALIDHVVGVLRETPRLLVIDECNNLYGRDRSGDNILNTLRQINDQAHCGVALVGTQGLESFLQAPRYRDRMEMILSRISQVVRVGAPSEGEVEAFVEAFFGAMGEATRKAFFAGLNANRGKRELYATKNSFRRTTAWVAHVQRILALNPGEGLSAEVARAGWERMTRE